MFSVQQRACRSDINLWINLVFIFCQICKDSFLCTFCPTQFLLGKPKWSCFDPKRKCFNWMKMPANPGIQKMSWVRPWRRSDLGSVSGVFRVSSYLCPGLIWLWYMSKLHSLPQKVNPKGTAAAEAAYQLLRLCCSLTAISQGISVHSLMSQRLGSSAGGCSPGQVWKPTKPCAEACWCQNEVELPANWEPCLGARVVRRVVLCAVQVLMWAKKKTLVQPLTGFVFPPPPFAWCCMFRGKWYTRAHPSYTRVGWLCCLSRGTADPSIADCAAEQQHHICFAGGETEAHSTGFSSQSGRNPRPEPKCFLLGLPFLCRAIRESKFLRGYRGAIAAPGMLHVVELGSLHVTARAFDCHLLPSPCLYKRARGRTAGLEQAAQKCWVKNSSGGGKKEEEKACHVLPVNTISDTELMGGLCGISIYISQSDFPRQKDTNRTFRDQSL